MDIRDYWKQVICDYISCLADNEKYENLTDEDLDAIVDNLLNDDQMWSEIEGTIDYYLGRIL